MTPKVGPPQLLAVPKISPGLNSDATFELAVDSMVSIIAEMPLTNNTEIDGRITDITGFLDASGGIVWPE
jgi:hypothetical protein